MRVMVGGIGAVLGEGGVNFGGSFGNSFGDVFDEENIGGELGDAFAVAALSLRDFEHGTSYDAGGGWEDWAVRFIDHLIHALREEDHAVGIAVVENAKIILVHGVS